MRYPIGREPSRSGNDCAEEDQRETEREALIGFDVVDPPTRCTSQRSICLVGSRARPGSTPVDWLRASYDTLRLVATGRHKICGSNCVWHLCPAPSNTYATVVGRIT